MSQVIPPGKTPIESETISFWSEFAELLGLNRSVGEVYGHLFISGAPLCADDIVERTNASRSGSGQHLKLLTEIGAIRIAQSVDSRKTHYELQTDLGILVRRLTHGRIFPKLVELNAQKESIHRQATKANDQLLIERFEKLDRWKNKIEPIALALKSLI